MQEIVRADRDLDTLSCPDCKLPLSGMRCVGCHVEFDIVNGVPNLITRDSRFRRVSEIISDYDALYDSSDNPWEEKGGRTTEFLEWLSSMIGSHLGVNYLEIGCGEGHLLSRIRAPHKYATDLSMVALERARSQTSARFHLALAERLPFFSDYFDVIGAVGVMEHFLDEAEALEELHRVLVPGGHLITLSHVKLTRWERAQLKIRQFVYPIPRPVAFVRWVFGRVAKTQAVQSHRGQVIQNRYTTTSARRTIERAGFKVVDVLHTRKDPQLPLVAPWVVIYVCHKENDSP